MVGWTELDTGSDSAWIFHTRISVGFAKARALPTTRITR